MSWGISFVIHLCCNIRADSREGEGKAKLLSVQFAQVRFKIISKLYCFSGVIQVQRLLSATNDELCVRQKC